MNKPIIRIFISKYIQEASSNAVAVVKHSRIPSVGEHIFLEYSTHKVIRVEHILNASDDTPCANVYLKEKES